MHGSYHYYDCGALTEDDYLTFPLSQLKGYEADDEYICEWAAFFYEQPEWLQSMGGMADGSEIVAIYKDYLIGGACISSMPDIPDITGDTALKVMNEYGDDILGFIAYFLDFIEEEIGEIPTTEQEEAWAGVAVWCVKKAIVLWVAEIMGEIESALIEAEEQKYLYG